MPKKPSGKKKPVKKMTVKKKPAKKTAKKKSSRKLGAMKPKNEKTRQILSQRPAPAVWKKALAERIHSKVRHKQFVEIRPAERLEAALHHQGRFHKNHCSHTRMDGPQKIQQKIQIQEKIILSSAR